MTLEVQTEAEAEDPLVNAFAADVSLALINMNAARVPLPVGLESFGVWAELKGSAWYCIATRAVMQNVRKSARRE